MAYALAAFAMRHYLPNLLHSGWWCWIFYSKGVTPKFMNTLKCFFLSLAFLKGKEGKNVVEGWILKKGGHSLRPFQEHYACCVLHIEYDTHILVETESCLRIWDVRMNPHEWRFPRKITASKSCIFSRTSTHDPSSKPNLKLEVKGCSHGVI